MLPLWWQHSCDAIVIILQFNRSRTACFQNEQHSGSQDRFWIPEVRELGGCEPMSSCFQPLSFRWLQLPWRTPSQESIADLCYHSSPGYLEKLLTFFDYLKFYFDLIFQIIFKSDLKTQFHPCACLFHCLGEVMDFYFQYLIFYCVFK